MQPREFVASFRVDGRKPELWDATTGRIDKNPDWQRKSGRTDVSLKLNPAESVFVVFSEPTKEMSGKAPVSESVNIPLNTDNWNMAFNTTGRTIETDTLFDWTTHNDNDVKFYSGTAQYTTTFAMPEVKDGEQIILNLDGLHDVATVSVNGRDCGIVWTAPYAIDITDAVHSGKNELSISVTNTWANALLGSDSGTAPFDGIWTNGKYRREEQTLIPAGLTGPLTLTVITK